MYTSPATMLGRVALGETRRMHLMQQFEGAGPVELETAARTVIMTKVDRRGLAAGTIWSSRETLKSELRKTVTCAR